MKDAGKSRELTVLKTQNQNGIKPQS